MSLRFRSDARPEQLAKDLLLSPLIYIRLLGILCSIIVFGCVADKVLDNGNCLYNFSTACNFAIAVGVIGFLFCLAFLVKDIMLVVIDYSDQLVVKKVIIIVDAITNGLWGFMWFVCFAYTADQLRKTENIGIFPSSVGNCARTGVAFSFFCILIWIAIVVVNIFLLIRIIKGSDRDGQGGTSGSGYASFPEAAADQPYQGEGGETGGGGGGQQYSPPEY